MILVFWMLSFKPVFSFSSFTFIKRLFSSNKWRTNRWEFFLHSLSHPCLIKVKLPQTISVHRWGIHGVFQLQQDVRSYLRHSWHIGASVSEKYLNLSLILFAFSDQLSQYLSKICKYLVFSIFLWNFWDTDYLPEIFWNSLKCWLYVSLWNDKSLCCYCSVVKSSLTLWDPMNCSMLVFPVLHCLLEFAQIHVC